MLRPQGLRVSDRTAERRFDDWPTPAAPEARQRAPETLWRAPDSPDQRLDPSDQHASDVLLLQAVRRDLVRRLQPVPTPVDTAVIAHAQPAYASSLADQLALVGIQVLLSTDDGAAALGAVVAQQPSVLICGDRLSRLAGCALLAEASLSSPTTVLIARVDDGAEQVAREAGAAVAVLRGDPPADVVALLARMLAGRS